MKTEARIRYIVNWIKKYCNSIKTENCINALLADGSCPTDTPGPSPNPSPNPSPANPTS